MAHCYTGYTGQARIVVVDTDLVVVVPRLEVVADPIVVAIHSELMVVVVAPTSDHYA